MPEEIIKLKRIIINYKQCNNKKKSTIVFKSSDYDLDKDERKVKYKDYDFVLCEKCNQKINRDWHCKKCYKEENDEGKYRMLYGRCRRCFQVMTIQNWCSPCNSNRFQQEFDKWASGNKHIDELIQDSQTSASSNHILEWIPYDSFTDINFIAKGGFAKVYSAIWEDGRIEKWDQASNDWKRSGPLKVALKILDNSKDPSEDFLSELKFLKKFPSYYYIYVIECYGITQEPNTFNYALVFKLKDCSLRSYLNDHFELTTLKDKLDVIKHICLGLNCIHSHNIIHRDLHSGNILYSRTESKLFISDFGFCKPAGEISNSKEKKIYGVVPYMAPEILRGKEYTKASDIYSLGIIINEIIFGNPPFNSRPFDEKLALCICYGLRPCIRSETPKPLEVLIRKCWDANPENRPDTDQIYNMLQDFIYTKNSGGNFKNYTEEYEKCKNERYLLKNEELDELSNDVQVKVSSPLESPKELREINFQPKYQSSLVHHLTVPKISTKSTSIYIIDDECLECAINNNKFTHTGSYNFKKHTEEYENNKNEHELSKSREITFQPKYHLAVPKIPKSSKFFYTTDECLECAIK